MDFSKRTICFLLLILLLFLLPSGAFAAAEDYSGKTVLLYTCGSSESSQDAPYAALKAYASRYESLGATVLTFSLGDDFYASGFDDKSEGMDTLFLMNAAGYTAYAVGEADFSYGVTRLLDLGMGANFDLLCCNCTTKKGEMTFLPSALYNGVGVVAFCSPRTETDVADDKLEARIFNGDVLDILIQQTIDELQAQGAESIVVLAHTGSSEAYSPWRSEDLLPRLSGADVWISAHDSASSVYNETDADGMSVLCAPASGQRVGGIVFDSLSYQALALDAIEPDKTADELEKKMSYPAPTGANTGDFTPAFLSFLFTSLLLVILALRVRRSV